MILPDLLLQDLRTVAGFNEPQFLLAHEQAALTSIRYHPVKSGSLIKGGDAVPWCHDGRYLDTRPVFTLDPAYHGGAYYVQEASSMFLAHMWKGIFPDTKGMRVLDLCAAPGGKSTLIASLLDKESLLISNEVIRSRASILEENMSRWGYMNTWVACNDPRDFTKLSGYFDVIVIDAPCSGSGLFRKDVRALEDWTQANVELCSARQQRIIADIWPALKKDGVLIYATCSFSTQEDEQLLDKIAEEYDMQTLPVPINNEWGITEVISPQKGMIGYRFFPGKTKGEGFFIAAIQKKESADTLRPAKYKPQQFPKIRTQAEYLLNSDNEIQYIQPGKEEYHAISMAHEADWELLQKALYFRKAGVNMGSPAAKEWIPAHDVALSIDISSSVPFIEVNRDQALRFLKKEDMELSEMAKGWQVIKFNNLGLGWVKSLGTRVNNYLPKHWRIRMEIPDMDIP